MAATKPVDDVVALRRRALTLRATADALADAYNRSTWIRFVGVFFPIPFVVVLFRLSLDAWTYYVTGAAIIVSAAILYMIDGAASSKVDAAAAAADRAEAAYDAALAAERRLRPP